MAEHLAKKKSAVDSFLECPLCLHQLKLPQTLQQCLHSYCKSCLGKVQQKKNHGRQGWLCPMCEQFTKCDQVQQNSFIEELQKIHLEPEHGDQIKCEQCSDDCGRAMWKCAQCKIGVCENGKEVHLRIPMLKGHKVIPLHSDGENVIDNIVFCKVHKGIPVQLNCYDCKNLICSTCNTTYHKRHAVETVEQALERILPESESSAKQVDENISIIKAQIEGVNYEFGKIKESYASIRMQMDDHLEKVICRIRAIKAQIEEDVNEQESIALDTLKEFKQQLEKQESQARIISHLTAVVTSKTKHASQLQQLQNGLFEKVKSAGKKKKKSLCFKLPTTDFIEGKKFQEEIDKVFGKLVFDIKEQIIDISGESYTKPNQFLCSDFKELAVAQFKKDKEIVVDADWCNKLSYIDNNIWLPLRERTKINIYDEAGELKHVIDTGGKSIIALKITYNKEVICAGDSGLFVTDKQFSKWTKLSDGTFSDVVMDKDQFIALQYDDPSVHTYELKESSWHKSQSFMLNNDVKVNCGSSICILDEEYLLISTKLHGIYKLTCAGEYLDICDDLPSYLFYPIICGTDKNDQVLVADFPSGAMHLFKPLSEKRVQRTAVLSDVQTNHTRSVIIDKNYNLWVLVGDLNYIVFELIKFAYRH